MPVTYVWLSSMNWDSSSFVFVLARQCQLVSCSYYAQGCSVANLRDENFFHSYSEHACCLILYIYKSDGVQIFTNSKWYFSSIEQKLHVISTKCTFSGFRPLRVFNIFIKYLNCVWKSYQNDIKWYLLFGNDMKSRN